MRPPPATPAQTIELGVQPGIQLDPDLFRRESARMLVALTRLFGIHNLALAEDVVQDAFCRAVELWKFHGPPPNPSAWLMTTAKHRAIDIFRREGTARTYAPELTRWLQSEWTLAPTIAETFNPHVIQDEELRMIFSCCHPRLPHRAQVALILNILCGFSVQEIAAAFIDSPASTQKRLTRGKKALAAARSLFTLASADLAPRLSAVHRALYLLINEGYHGAGPSTTVRAALCEFELSCHNPAAAHVHLTRALTLARNPAERHFLTHRLAATSQ